MKIKERRDWYCLFIALFMLSLVVACGGGGSSDGDGGVVGGGTISFVLNGTSISLSGSQVGAAYSTIDVVDPDIPAGHTVIMGMQSNTGPSILMVINGSALKNYYISRKRRSRVYTD